MIILEQSLVPKNPRRKSEDGLVITDDFIAVIDGSTSKTTTRYCPWMSNGRYAMQIVSSYIRNMKPDVSCHQFCIGVTRAIQKKYVPFWKRSRRNAILAHIWDCPEERMTASAVIFSRKRREIWMIGDCQCLIGGELVENPKPYEQTLAEIRAEKIRELLSEGRTPEEILAHDEGRAAVIPRMLKEMKSQNVSYSVIDGFTIPEDKVPVIALDFRPWEIVFASDGYPFLCSTLEESEQRLSQQRTNDPLNIGDFKATKGFTPGNNSFDDRTYVRFQV